MSKVLLHNLSIPYQNQHPNLYSFDQNSIYFAEPNDVVIVRQRPDKAFLDYLTKEKVVAESIRFVESDTSLEPFPVFADKKLQDSLSVVETEKQCELDVFMPTEYEHKLAKQLGFHYPYPADQYQKYVGKSLFRSTCKELDIPVPLGAEFMETGQQVSKKASKLFGQGALEVVIKQDDGVAGLSTHWLTEETLQSIIDNEVLDNLLPPQTIATNEPRYIVEQWHQDVVSSPSSQLFIDEDGQVVILSLHQQLMKPNSSTYVGCLSEQALSSKVKGELEQYSLVYATELAKQGYYGHLAFNAIVTKSNKFFFTELNPRRVMSSYPFQIMRNLGYDRNNLPFYKSIELTVSDWKGKDPSQILEILGESLYTREKGWGIILFDIKLLASHGVVMLLAIGSTQEEVESLLNYG